MNSSLLFTNYITGTVYINGAIHLGADEDGYRPFGNLRNSHVYKINTIVDLKDIGLFFQSWFFTCT